MRQALLCFALLAVVIATAFLPLFQRAQVLRSNDVPVGVLQAKYMEMPESASGSWHDLNWIGVELPSTPPSFILLRSFCSAQTVAKFFGPLSLLFVGLASWYFFRRVGLGPEACLLGALASVLNTFIFSSVCWGTLGFVFAWAWSFLALAALLPVSGPRLLLRTILAGLCVGMSIMEGIDVAALFSLLIAAAVVYSEWIQPGPVWRRLLRGGGRTALVALCAALVSAQALSSLVHTQVEGVGVLEDPKTSKDEKWNWATQWSLPKIETLSFAVPGLFGYRMDSPDGGNYWGSGGRDPRLDAWFDAGRQGAPPQGLMRFGGGGIYAGALVLLLALWAIQRSLRHPGTGLTVEGRRWIWFWTGVVVVSLLLAWGRFAPFYQIVFHLPGLSSIRNPVKFAHMTSFALVILFAYGVDGLFRLNSAPPVSGRNKAGSPKPFWKLVQAADGAFALLALGLLGAVALGWLVYASSRPALENYLQSVQFEPGLAAAIAKFSIGQVGWGVGRYVLAVGVVLLVLSGWFSGSRRRWAVVLLGAVLVVDLVPANHPFIFYVDVPRKYDANPVVEFLKRCGPNARVALLPFNPPPGQSLLQGLYSIEWAQHHFQAENIQSLDIVQMPRPPKDRQAYESALQPSGDLASLRVMARRWELTSTRYLLGSVELQLPWGAQQTLGFLNQAVDPAAQRFREVERFALIPKPGVTQPKTYEDFTAVLSTNGPYALFEFTGALPKVSLYTRWQVQTNDDVTLKTIAGADFDPHREVLVAQPIAPPTADAPTNAAVPVEFASYAPTVLTLHTRADSPAVLLLNDRYDPDWSVTVDGQSAELLRCNYIMRGVQLSPGEHRVEFRLQLSKTGLYVSFASMAIGVVLVGLLILLKPPQTPEGNPQPAATSNRRPTAGPPAKEA